MRKSLLFILFYSLLFVSLRAQSDTSFVPVERLLKIKVKGKYGLINLKGQIIVEPEYIYIGSLGNGWELEDTVKKSKYKIVNNYGKTISEEWFNGGGLGFCEGFYVVKKIRMWGCINDSGKVVIPFEYDNIGVFIDGFAIATKQGQQGILSERGEFTLMIEYDALTNCSEGYFRVKSGTSYGMYDARRKKLVLNVVYKILTDVHNGKVIINNKQIFKLADEKILYEAKSGWKIESGCVHCSYDCYCKCDDELYTLRKKNRYALIQEQGEYIIQPGKQHIGVFRGGFALMEDKRGRRMMINKKGEKVFDIKSGYSFGFFYDGIAKVSYNNKYGFADTTGKIIIPIIYDFAFDFDDTGTAKIFQGATSFQDIDRDGVRMGYINRNGYPIWVPTE